MQKFKNFKHLSTKNIMPLFPKAINDLKLDLGIMENLFSLILYTFWKDRNGIYRGCNSAWMDLIRSKYFSYKSNVIGKTTFELIPDPESARMIEETDHGIMDSGRISILEERLNTPGGIKTYLSQKQPLYDSENIVIGMLGFAIDITQTENRITDITTGKYFNAIGAALCGYNERFSAVSDSSIETTDKKTAKIDSLLSQSQNTQDAITISHRELECIKLLKEGLSSKQIALILNISKRTVEQYIDTAKNKLNCKNSVELIYKCFRNGILQ